MYVNSTPKWLWNTSQEIPIWKEIFKKNSLKTCQTTIGPISQTHPLSKIIAVIRCKISHTCAHVREQRVSRTRLTKSGVQFGNWRQLPLSPMMSNLNKWSYSRAPIFDVVVPCKKRQRGPRKPFFAALWAAINKLRFRQRPKLCARERKGRRISRRSVGYFFPAVARVCHFRARKCELVKRPKRPSRYLFQRDTSVYFAICDSEKTTTQWKTLSRAGILGVGWLAAVDLKARARGERFWLVLTKAMILFGFLDFRWWFYEWLEKKFWERWFLQKARTARSARADFMGGFVGLLVALVTLRAFVFFYKFFTYKK